MDFKRVSHQWDLAVEHWTAARYRDAYECFDAIPDPPMAIVFNVAVLQMMHDAYDIAHENFSIILKLDPQLAIGYFLRGIVACHLKWYQESREDFEDCHRTMDGKKYINYQPLGMETILSEYQVLANLSMICARLDGDAGKGLAHMVNAYSKQGCMFQDSLFRKEMEEIGQPLEEELPFFEDILGPCQEGSCPLVRFQRLPFFRNDGLLLKTFKHQQEMNLCYIGDENKSATILYESGSKEFKKSNVSIFKLRRRRSRAPILLNAIKSPVPPATSPNGYLSRASVIESSPATHGGLQPLAGPESPGALQRRRSTMDCAGTGMRLDCEEDGGRRPSRNYHCGLEAVNLLTTQCKSLTDVSGGDDGREEQPRRYSMTRRRSRSVEPGHPDSSPGSEQELSLTVTSRRTMPNFSPMAVTRERSGSLSNISALSVGTDPTSPPNAVTSPSRFGSYKAPSPLVRSGSATLFSFTESPKPLSPPATETPSSSAVTSQQMRGTKSEPNRKPAFQLSRFERSASQDSNLIGSPLLAKPPPQQQHLRQADNDGGAIHSDDDDIGLTRGRASLRRDESSSSCSTNCSAGKGRVSTTTISESDALTSPQPAANRRIANHYHRAPESMPSELSSWTSDGSRMSGITRRKRTRRASSPVRPIQIACTSMRELAEKISRLRRVDQACTINIIVQPVRASVVPK